MQVKFNLSQKIFLSNDCFTGTLQKGKKWLSLGFVLEELSLTGKRNIQTNNDDTVYYGREKHTKCVQKEMINSF